MPSVLNDLLLATLILWLLRSWLPRQPRLQAGRGQLILRPPLGPLVWRTSRTVLWFVIAVYAVAIMVSLKLWWGALLGLVVLLGLALQLRLLWQRHSVVFDRRADRIRLGPTLVSPASQAAGIQVTGQDSAPLMVLLRDDGSAGHYWVVPGVDITHAPEMGRSIADYLDIPLVSRVE